MVSTSMGLTPPPGLFIPSGFATPLTLACVLFFLRGGGEDFSYTDLSYVVLIVVITMSFCKFPQSCFFGL